MGYETAGSPARAVRVETFGVYVVRGGDAHLDTADDVEGRIRQLLADSGAPTPNQVLVHHMQAPSSATNSSNWLDDLIATLPPETTTPTAPPPDPPQALIFHQETGAAASRYITIVLGS